jgi:DNA-binding CsgD family transcriptional regulator
VRAHWNLTLVAEQLQHAAVDPSVWPDVLSNLSRQVGAEGTFIVSTETRLAGTPGSPEIAGLVEDYYRNRWNERDERYRCLPSLLAKGVAVDQDFASLEEMKSSPYYQEFLGRHGLRGFAGVGFKAGEDLWAVAIQRRIGQGLFDSDEQKRLVKLWRPLSDAATLSRQLGFARVLGIADALELTKQPAMIFDARGRVLALNSLADDLLGELIDVVGRTLVFRDPQSQSLFDRLLGDALAAALIERPEPAATVVRDQMGQHVTVRAIALRGWARFTFANARVLLLIGNNRPKVESASSILATTFGLTAAEARLAAVLGAGHSIAQAADQLGIGYETARTQVKAIFLKTDTRRQAQLIALMARLTVE